MQVNGEVFDLDRVLEGDCTLEFLKFEDDEGKLGLLQIMNFTVHHPIFVLLCPSQHAVPGHDSSWSLGTSFCQE